jgi:hypothetical protein
MAARTVFLEGRWPRREADHSVALSVEVMLALYLHSPIHLRRALLNADRVVSLSGSSGVNPWKLYLTFEGGGVRGGNY